MMDYLLANNAKVHLPRRQVRVEARITANAAAVRCSAWFGPSYPSR